MLHLHTGTQRVGRRSDAAQEHPCPHIIDCSSARCGIIIAPIAVKLGGAHALRPFGATLLEPLRCLVQSSHMTELIRPFTSTTTSTTTAASQTHHPLSFTSLPAPPLRSRLLLSAEPLSCDQPPARFRFSRTHPQRLRLAHALLLLSHSHSHALPLAALPVATLGSRALLQIHPPFRQTCLLACLPACFDCETLLPPLLRFRALRIPSSPSLNSGFARLHVHKRLLVLHFASLRLATHTPSRAPLIDLVTATRSSFEHP
jgi:hypothetical protein